MSFKSTVSEILHHDHNSIDAVERAQKAKASQIPQRLFKYRSFNKNNLNALKLDQLWCSSPRGFNDPYDCSLHFQIKDLGSLMLRVMKRMNSTLSDQGESDLFSQHDMDTVSRSEDPISATADALKAKNIGETSSLLENMERALHQHRDALVDSMKNGMTIGSLCERNDSMLMWSHYAANHTGFAIEYNLTTEGHEELATHLWPVFYQDSVFDISNTIFGAKTDHINDAFMIGAATHKATDWAYEKEWRIVHLRRHAGAGELINVPKPTAIYLGSHISADDKSAISSIANDRNIALYQMHQERKQFRMVIREHTPPSLA